MDMLQRGAGLVLTGGGSRLRHLVELCQYDLGLSTRIGIPGIGFADSLSNELKQPMYSTALGLLKYGIEKQTSGIQYPEENISDEEPADNQAKEPETRTTEPKKRPGELWKKLQKTMGQLFDQIS